MAVGLGSGKWCYPPPKWPKDSGLRYIVINLPNFLEYVFFLLDHNLESDEPLSQTPRHGFWKMRNLSAKWLNIQHLEPKTSSWKWLFQLDDESNLYIENCYSTRSIHLRLVVWSFKSRSRQTNDHFNIQTHVSNDSVVRWFVSRVVFCL